MPGPNFKLNNGSVIPGIGLGTWKSGPNEVARAVEEALKAGYRHIDCAWSYGNEKEVGAGLRASGVPREEVFITSNLWCTYHSRVEECLDETLANLGTDYVDLYLVHWPVALNQSGNHPVFPTRPNGNRDIDESRDIRDTWKAMEAVCKKGKAKAIGASNFSEKILQKILPTEIPPAVDQLELHLYNPQHKLIDYLKSQNIVPQAYSPLGSNYAPLMTDETAAEIAKKHGLATTDVLLGYLLKKDIVVLPKSVTPARIKTNLDNTITAYEKLTEEDVAVLDAVAANGKQKRLVTPPWGIDLGFDNWPVLTQTA
ncbi:Aldo keto reductase [Coniophora puteana RWD-64-598 SS2]|uniref:Aldo keto reductase n=1 Tax=Coniophora puteana (strain RWD-64-598) TaxID=741705 RepID=A0A5M3MG31_CONPW|nr:Aldo keto reductase [Coniophora puteana RWD-64-598 SS2]EIW78172.1 Aldo keto reductase [Coniophora puteana RWD-64-598 SS2]